MSVHLGKEIVNLKKMILELCTFVEESLCMAVDAVESLDEAKAELVIVRDKEIDQKEIEIEEECLKILALYQPVAIDLRYVVACLKLNNDLERIGDLAKKIAKKTIKLRLLTPNALPFDFSEIEEKTIEMIRKSIEALIESDVQLAMKVCVADDVVDDLEEEIKKNVTEKIRNNSFSVDLGLSLIGVARNLERIADYATNIAEDVIYLVSGDIVRHKGI
jgi:phosphate transport system protein